MGDGEVGGGETEREVGRDGGRGGRRREEEGEVGGGETERERWEEEGEVGGGETEGGWEKEGIWRERWGEGGRRGGRERREEIKGGRKEESTQRRGGRERGETKRLVREGSKGMNFTNTGTLIASPGLSISSPTFKSSLLQQRPHLEFGQCCHDLPKC